MAKMESINQRSTFNVVFGRRGSTLLASKPWVTDTYRPDPADRVREDAGDGKLLTSPGVWQRESQQIVLIISKFKHLIASRVYFLAEIGKAV